MRTVILLLLFSMPLILTAQKQLPIGEGVIIFDLTKTNSVQLYNDTASVSPAQIVHLKVNNVGVAEIDSIAVKWFEPEQFYAAYDIFILRVHAQRGSWLHVFVNNSGKLYWMKLNPIDRFMTWPDFLLRKVNAISADAWNKPAIKASPVNTSKTIKLIEQADCFDILEIKGDWIHIQTDTESECSDSKKPVKSGWIQWKEGGRLMVGYTLVV